MTSLSGLPDDDKKQLDCNATARLAKTKPLDCHSPAGFAMTTALIIARTEGAWRSSKIQCTFD
jgi:hypothetical protein